MLPLRRDKSFPEALRALRDELDLTRNELAAKCDTYGSNIRRYESQNSINFAVPNQTTYRKLVKVLTEAKVARDNANGYTAPPKVNPLFEGRVETYWQPVNRPHRVH